MPATDDPPPPGSDAALERGCTCPVLDNGRGRGIAGRDGQTNWWITKGCPVHDAGREGDDAEN